MLFRVDLKSSKYLIHQFLIFINKQLIVVIYYHLRFDTGGVHFQELCPPPLLPRIFEDQIKLMKIMTSQGMECFILFHTFLKNLSISPIQRIEPNYT